MPDNRKPDPKTFLEDPAFQSDREIFSAFIDAHLEKRAAEAKKRAEEQQQNEPQSIFDVLFGGRK